MNGLINKSAPFFIAAIIAIMAPILTITMAIYLVGALEGKTALATEAQREHAKYYTSEVVELDMSTNNIILENGTQLNVMRGWRQALVPDVGDVVSYGETIKYYPSVFANGVHTSNEPIYIDKRVIGTTKQQQ